GAHLCGGVSVGKRVFIGAGATIIPNINIGRDAVIGAGATVICDIPDEVTVVGTPARIVRRECR
ncbi:MAG: serine acetyltransferase, partial [bacterium]|nr:serine acetyltransferase [bacterium]